MNLKALVLVAAAALCGVANASSGPIVSLKTGQIQGVEINGTHQYLGVPFAAPPIKDLRWKAPQPPASWTGIRQATTDGATCMQNSDAFTILQKVSEDCLYLNVYHPGHPAPNNGSYPIMLFFFGGSWKYGSANFLVYDAVPDVSEMEDVIIIAANYRLQAFGWLASTELKADASDGSAGNYGLQDQRAAMQWVQDNAVALGGDPNNVLIFGESAGAGSVSGHLTNKRSWGLFHRALMESGPIAPWVAQPMNTSQPKFDTLAKHLDCDGATDILACMRAANGTAVLHASGGLPSGFQEWSPVVDGVEFAEYPEDLAAKGEIAPVPVLLGTNKDEGTLFVPLKSDATAAQATAWLNTTFAPVFDQIMELYPFANYKSPYFQAEHVLGDAFMSCPARRTARWVQKGGQDAYLYFYNHVLEVIQLFKPDYGCCHASELVMVFDTKLAMWGAGEPNLSRQFIFYWTRFAASGDPNKPIPGSTAKLPTSLPTWPVYDNSTDMVQQLDIPVTSVGALKKSFCDFWDTVPINPADIYSPGHM